MKYIDCQKYAIKILNEAKKMQHSKYFVIVSVGNDSASQSYIKGKIKDCEYCGIPYIHKTIDPNTYGAKEKLERLLLEMSLRQDVSSIILQLPLPQGWDETHFLRFILPEKDVDGLSSCSPFSPCTPEGIVHILREELGDLTGKTALIIGRGKLVGRPLIGMLLSQNCTITVAHSKSKTEEVFYGAKYDIVICAAGQPNLLALAKLQGEPIVIDAGVNRVEGKLQGDCCSFTDNKYIKPNMLVTPVPKGIGLMTRAMLVQHIAKTNQGDFNE